jgi:hypothetical protein
VTGEPVAAEDAALARAIEFVRLGMRSGLITAETGEVMIDAAEQHCRELTDRLKETGETDT